MESKRMFEIIALINAAIRVGYSFAEITSRLVADGYEVPTEEEYEARTAELRELPDLADADAELEAELEGEA